MAIVKQPVGARTALTFAALPTLASAAYGTSSTKDNTANAPVDLLVELSITPGSVAGNKQAVLYGLASLDGTNFQTGANATDSIAMTLIGVLPLPSSAVKQTKHFGVAMAYGGVMPPFQQFVVLNDSGAAFTAGTIFISEINPTVV
jgi:hypothetical protein